MPTIPKTKNSMHKTYYFYLNDHLATPQKLISSNGATVWSADYESFGSATVNVNTVENNLRFPGQYYDVETGEHYNWNRTYMPNIGRYSQVDPIGFDGGDLNLFRYVSHSPIIWVDSSGLNAFIPEKLGVYIPEIFIPSANNIFPKNTEKENVKGKCKKKRCKKCIPEEGMIGYQIHPPHQRGRHRMPHVKLWRMNQHPLGSPPQYECQCWWSKPFYLENTQTQPPGSVLWTPAAGGGVEEYYE